MNDLISFIVKYSKWFFLIFYVILSCILLFNNNPYQHHVYLTSAGAVTSSIYKGANNVSSYFHLQDINEDLQLKCANLDLEVIKLKKQLRSYQEKYDIDSSIPYSGMPQFEFILSHVINNSINKPHNYITINKGSNDGIKPEMGVIDQNGIVGIVNVVGDNSARIISLLNLNFKLSCKIKGNKHFGSLAWDGEDPTIAILEELPRHTVFKAGDTVVTSGFSAVFPEDIMVGKIISDKNNQNDNSISLKVKLSTDFTKLSKVRVIVNNLKEELDSLESSDNQKSKNK